jgi:ribosomal protein L7/L12
MNTFSGSEMVLVMLLLVVLGIGIGSMIASASNPAKRPSTLWRVEAKLDLLLKQAGVEFEPYKGLSPEVAEALQRGEKIRAIKHYREATGVSLREAKDFIEEVERRTS